MLCIGRPPRLRAPTDWLEAIIPNSGFPCVATLGEIERGIVRPVLDTVIAATALVHDLVVVTRDVRDFDDTGVRLLNPWSLG